MIWFSVFLLMVFTAQFTAFMVWHSYLAAGLTSVSIVLILFSVRLNIYTLGLRQKTEGYLELLMRLRKEK